MRILYGIGLGLGLAIAPGYSAVAQSPDPEPQTTLTSSVKGDCGPEQPCDELLQTLRSQWPTAKLNCKRDRVLSLTVIDNPRGGRNVQVTCWDTELTKGDRYGLARTYLPYPGDEAQFLPPLPARARYTETLNSQFSDTVQASQTECGLLDGEILYRSHKKMDLLELQCIFTVSTLLVDTDDDFVADGEADSGKIVNKIVGKFALSDLETSATQPPTADPSGADPDQNNSLSSEQPGLKAINVQVYDRLQNQVVPLNQPWNPYGLGMDLLISVKVQPGDPFPPPGTKLKLAVDAKGYESPATGSVEDWRLVKTQEISFVSGGQTSQSFPFLAEYKCYPQVQVTATLIPPGQSEGSSLTKNLDLSCAD